MTEMHPAPADETGAVAAPREYRNLALIGFMGTGKSTVGQAAAAQLQFEFADTDRLIEAVAGMTVHQIFTRFGESVFRGLEKRVVADLARRRDTVIATGGGLGANTDHMASLKSHALVVCLWASAEVIWERVHHQTHRPLLQVPDPLGRIGQLLAQREPAYRQADVLINTGLRQFREVVQQVVHNFQLARGGER